MNAIPSVSESQTSSLRSLLQMALSLETQELARLKEECSSLPPGSLSINRKGERYYFLEITDGRRRGITRDRERIYSLARKRYLLLRKRILEKDMSTLISAASPAGRNLSSSVMTLLEQYHSAGLDIARITMTPEQYAWMHAQYRKNPHYPETLKFVTNSGIRVRSKSELLIANQLELFGIPYRYEQALDVDVSSLQGLAGTRQGRYKTYYPDFTIMTASGKLIFWEHLGLLDLPDYRTAAYEKIFIYRQLGGIREQNMIITVEADMTDICKINEIIEQRILLNY